MIGFNEVNKKNTYYKIIQMSSKYQDGKSFAIDEVVISDKKVNLSAEVPEEMGGFCISDYKHIFRWLIRGDTLCEIVIPEDSKIYKTESENVIYISDKIILSNPVKINDALAMTLYDNSILPETSYFYALAACSIKGYINTAMKVLSEKVTKDNIDFAIQESESFCNRREKEFKYKVFKLESVKLIQNELLKISKH